MANGSDISISQLPAGVRSLVEGKGVVVDGKVSSEVLQKLLSEINQSCVYSIALKDEAKNVLTNLNNGTLQSLNGNANWGNFDQVNFSYVADVQPASDKAEVKKVSGESEHISGLKKIKEKFKDILSKRDRKNEESIRNEYCLLTWISCETLDSLCHDPRTSLIFQFCKNNDKEAWNNYIDEHAAEINELFNDELADIIEGNSLSDYLKSKDNPVEALYEVSDNFSEKKCILDWTPEEISSAKNNDYKGRVNRFGTIIKNFLCKIAEENNDEILKMTSDYRSKLKEKSDEADSDFYKAWEDFTIPVTEWYNSLPAISHEDAVDSITMKDLVYEVNYALFHLLNADNSRKRVFNDYVWFKDYDISFSEYEFKY